MTAIETKFSIGDVVYYASTTTTQKQHPCPDCKGERKWKAISPAGGEYSFNCPRCSSSYRANDELSLAYAASVPLVQKLTIGSVKYDSHPGSGRSPAQYMCRETGVGGGTIYDEARLFATEEGAQRAAEAMAAHQDQTTGWIVKQYNKSLSISDYQLENGKLKLAGDAETRARSMLWNIGDLFDKIDRAEDKDEILEAVADYKRWDWEADKKRADEEAAA
jgi:hypothetical protein